MIQYHTVKQRNQRVPLNAGLTLMLKGNLLIQNHTVTQRKQRVPLNGTYRVAKGERDVRSVVVPGDHANAHAHHGPLAPHLFQQQPPDAETLLKQKQTLKLAPVKINRNLDIYC